MLFCFLFVANGATLQIRKFAVALAMFFTIAMLIIMTYTYSIYNKRQVTFYPNSSFFTFKATQPLITLGESWCYFRDYKGSICENYIIYVEDKKQNLKYDNL